MKNLLKILLLSFTVLLFNCDGNDDNNLGNENPEEGWIEFKIAERSLPFGDTEMLLPIQINVPIYRDGLRIGYRIEPVIGDFTQIISSNPNGSIFVESSDTSREGSIPLSFVNLSSVSNEQIVFDVILDSVNNDNITIGLNTDSTIKVRVTKPCQNPSIIPSDFFIGNYAIADVDATIGPGNNTENFAASTVTLMADPLDPNKRIFTAGVLPAFNAQIENITLTFTPQGSIFLEFVDPSLSCGGGIDYVFDSQTVANSASWDICTGNDTNIIIPYVEDPNGSCGGPYDSSFSLIKI